MTTGAVPVNPKEENMTSTPVNTAPREDPMHWVARANVTDPLWDQFRGVMVIPTSYTEEQADDAVVLLVRERNGR